MLSRELPEDAIVTNGAGNYAGFLHRYFQYKGWPTQLAPTSGSMGYGLPAAIAAKLAHPERTVVALAGDGCLLMTGQELATAVQYGLPIIVIVANNGMYGTIRMHQERHYPGRVVGTTLINPDFVALARSFGVTAERVEATEAVPARAAPRACRRGTGIDRIAHRSRGHQHAADAVADPRKVAVDQAAASRVAAQLVNTSLNHRLLR